MLGWRARYPTLSIEDPFGQVIGDDPLVINAVLVKVNQAGTLSEATAACEAARRAGFGAIVCARSGETEDVAIVRLAIGWNASQLKVDSFARVELMAK